MEKNAVKTKEDYIKNLEVGTLIAFKVRDRMMSAKVIEVREEDVKVECKNGSVYYVGKNKDAIAWVKTGARWPSGIFNALRNNINE